MVHSGRHFLQVPGPTNVPDRVSRAIDCAMLDHRGPEFATLTHGILDDLGAIFKTTDPIVVFPSSGSGGWEAALVNTLAPGDRVLAFDQGFFADGWQGVAANFGLDVEVIAQDWRAGVDAGELEKRLHDDTDHDIKAILVVHNETTSGVTSDIGALRHAIDNAEHPALFMVDAVSSLASIDYRHDEWKVDVTVTGSQKGLMMPPGLGFNAISAKALAAAESARLPRAYWDWQPMLTANADGFFPYTPATGLLYGLREAIDMLLAEGLDNVFARHQRFGEATRCALAAWGLDNYALNPSEASNSVTTVLLPDGHDADALRALILERFDMSLGAGLGKLKGRVFRIGHLGHFNDLTLVGTLAGVEMGLQAASVPATAGGVQAALDYLAE